MIDVKFLLGRGMDPLQSMTADKPLSLFVGLGFILLVAKLKNKHINQVLFFFSLRHISLLTPFFLAFFKLNVVQVGHFFTLWSNDYLQYGRVDRARRRYYTKLFSFLYCLLPLILLVVVLILIFPPDKILRLETLFFFVLSLVYYLNTTEKLAQMYLSALNYFHFSYFEELESVYAPVLKAAISLGFHFGLTCLLLFKGRYFEVFFTLSPLVMLDVYELFSTEIDSSLGQLIRTKAMMAHYPFATVQQVINYDRVCAFCQGDMRRARITSCKHLFHTECLRRYITEGQNNNRCPMCRHRFPQMY